MSGDRTENVLWRALYVPKISYLKIVITLCETNNICVDSPYDIAQCLIDIGVFFRKNSFKIKIFIPGIVSSDECYSVNRVLLIKEINVTLKCKSLCIVLILLYKNKAGLITTTHFIIHYSIMKSCI